MNYGTWCVGGVKKTKLILVSLIILIKKVNKVYVQCWFKWCHICDSDNWLRQRIQGRNMLGNFFILGDTKMAAWEPKRVRVRWGLGKGDASHEWDWKYLRGGGPRDTVICLLLTKKDSCSGRGGCSGKRSLGRVGKTYMIRKFRTACMHICV